MICLLEGLKTARIMKITNGATHQVLVSMYSSWNSHALLVSLLNGTAIPENSLTISFKDKNILPYMT